jgi:outer membrane receptor protein involved in Fe transport
MKFYHHLTIGKNAPIGKILLMFKLITILVLASILQVHAAALGQNVSLNLNNANITKAFNELSKQTGYDFLYNLSSVKNVGPVTLSVKNLPLGEALKKCLYEHGLNFSIKGKTIIISVAETVVKSSVVRETAKSSVVGAVINEAGQPVANASVTLFSPARRDKIIAGVMTAVDGRFSITVNDTAKVILVIRAIGFESYESAPFELPSGEVRDFKNIQMKASVTRLNEVVVKSNVPLVELRLDKTVINVAGSVLSQGSNILEVLGHSPGVSVDNSGRLRLNGRSGVNVTVDGRTTYMSAEDLSKFLSSLPANRVKSVELLNNPSAKFDAAGDAGVINIVMKKNNTVGLIGSFQAGGQYNGEYGYLGNGALSYKTGKWRTNVSASYTRSDNDVDITAKRFVHRNDSTFLFDQATHKIVKNKNLYADGTVEYDFNSKQTVGGTVQYTLSKNPYNSSALTDISNEADNNVNNVLAKNDATGKSRRVATNAHYINHIDSVGTLLTADIDYVKVNNASFSALNNQYWPNGDIANSTFDKITTDNPATYNVFAAKLDFTTPVGKDKVLETGIKGSWVNANNDLDMEGYNGGIAIRDTGNSNIFKYREKIFAAYANYRTPLGKHFSAQAGLRLEYTNVFGRSETLSENNKSHYLNLFPSVSLQQKVNENYQIAYNFNRRLTRPDYQDFNPFIYYVDPYTLQQGNPGLKPMYSNNFEIRQIFKQDYQLSLTYSKTTNVFNQVFYQDDKTGITRTQISNLDELINYGANLSAPVKITKWWTTNNSVQLLHQQYKTVLNGQQLDRGKLTFTVNSQSSIQLPGGIKFELSGAYFGAQPNGQIEIHSFYLIDAGFQKSILKNKLTLNLNGSDILRSEKIKADVIFGNVNARINQYNGTQSVRLTLRYNFSKGKDFSVDKRSGSQDEQGRIR